VKTNLSIKINSKTQPWAERSANEVATKEKKSKTAEPAKGDSSVKAIAEQPKAVIEPEAQECDVQAAKSKAKAKAQAGKELGQKISESEFVSDDFQASSESDLAEIQDGMRKLGIDSMTQQALAATDGKSLCFISFPLSVCYYCFVVISCCLI